MCGIAGIMNLDGGPVNCADIKRMTDALAHRGPDGEGQWCDGPVGLGHRRLAIIDLSEEASQPMDSLDGRYVITYNGEVYNFRELRRELEKGGSRFRSHSDTEVVLEAVIRWGIDSAIKRFNGMFAFAIWDRKTQTLLLGRDRYGIKPLYIWTSPGKMAFASEPKAFRALPDFTPVLDAHGVAEYFTFQNILTDRTFLKDVRQFPSGSWGLMKIGHEPQEIQRDRYWDFDFQEPEHPGDEAEYAEELLHLLMQAVDRQLVADVEVGAYLSGGLDSGSIVAIAAERSPAMKTFTIGFEMAGVAEQELGFDERAAAESIARMAGTTQVEMVIGPRHVIACLPRLAYHMEEPRVGQSYPNYYAAELASHFAKVVLAGTGGDEILGGYPWRYPRRTDTAERFSEWHFRLWNRLLSREELYGLLNPIVGELGDFDPSSIHSNILGMSTNRHSDQSDDLLQSALYFEAKTFLSGLLAVEDRLGMSFGIETRFPFLDNDLVDFCLRLPRSARVGQDDPAPAPRGASSGKMVLRRAAKALLPDVVVTDQKRGFAGPDTAWFAGPLQPQLKELLESAPAEVFDLRNLVEMIMVRGGHVPHRLKSWSAVAGARAVSELLRG